MSTLIASNQTSPKEDAALVNKALKGFGSDEKALITILGHRNASQRNQLRLAYEEIFNENLIHRLESELSGHLEKAVYRWMLDPQERDAVLVNVAIKKSSPDTAVLIEIACVLSPDELFQVRRAYHGRYNRSLEEDVASNTSGDVRQLLVGLVTSYRYNGDQVDAKLAEMEADILHAAVKNKNKYDEVVRILSTRSKFQLLATFNRYRDKFENSISKTLLSGVGENDFIKSVHTAIRCINDHKKYYEKVLRNAMKGLIATDEDALTRVIVTRAEKDLKEIKELYYKKNSVSLDHEIAKKTRGDYEDFLLLLLGNDK